MMPERITLQGYLDVSKSLDETRTVHEQVTALSKGKEIECGCGFRSRSPLQLWRCFYCGAFFCWQCAEKHFGATLEEHDKKESEKSLQKREANVDCPPTTPHTMPLPPSPLTEEERTSVAAIVDRTGSITMEVAGLDRATVDKIIALIDSPAAAVKDGDCCYTVYLD